MVNRKVGFDQRAWDKGHVRSRFKEMIGMSMLADLDHPNIVKLHEIWEFNNTCFLVLEYCAGGELFNKLIEEGNLTEEATRDIMK